MVPNQAVQMVKLHCRLNPIKLRSVCAGTEPDTERSGTGQSRVAAVCVCASEGDNHMYWALHANGGVFMRTQFFFGYAIWLTPPLTLSTATAVAAERAAMMVMEVVVGVAGRT